MFVSFLIILSPAILSELPARLFVNEAFTPSAAIGEEYYNVPFYLPSFNQSSGGTLILKAEGQGTSKFIPGFP
jgi:hypothetical protein